MLTKPACSSETFPAASERLDQLRLLRGRALELTSWSEHPCSQSSFPVLAGRRPVLWVEAELHTARICRMVPACLLAHGKYGMTVPLRTVGHERALTANPAILLNRRG